LKILALSDTRFPTNLNYPGHGLGRSMARLTQELARQGHMVTLFAAHGSKVGGVRVLPDDNEAERGKWLASVGETETYDAIIDGTHEFTLANLRPDLPIVCKVVDRENPAPYRRVYGNTTLKSWLNDGQPYELVIEGVDINNIPYYPAGRGTNLVWTGYKQAMWKRPELAIQIAEKAGRPLMMIGEGLPLERVLDRHSHWSETSGFTGTTFYKWLGCAYALVQPVASMATLEAAATGTPSLGMMLEDDWVMPTVSGALATTVEEAAELIKDGYLESLSKWQMRTWVGDERNVTQMAKKWAELLQRAADGETW